MANQPGDLVFKQHARGDGLLVFGGTDGPSIEAAELSVDATFPELDASIRIDTPPPDGVHLLTVDASFPELDASIRVTAIRIAEIALDATFPELQANILVSSPVPLSVDASFPDLDASIGMLWDPNVSRIDFRIELHQAWQEASPVQHAVQSGWNEAQGLRAGVIGRWQEAVGVRAATRHHWQRAGQLRHVIAGHWQEGMRLRAATRQHWQDADHLRHMLRSSWQEGMPVRGSVQSRWEETQRLRLALRTRWEEAAGVRAITRPTFTDGLHIRIAHWPHWQEACRPPAGVSPDPKPPEPPKPEPCYDPNKLGDLVFKTLRQYSYDLVFVCWRHRDRAPIVVQPRRSFIVINSVLLFRVGDANPLPVESFAMSLDRNSWTYQWNATLHHSAAPQLEAVTPGAPIELEARINGVPYRLLARQPGRSRQLPVHNIKISGLGRNAVLAAPYAPTMSFAGTEERTAFQLMTDVLTFNGVGIGWGLDYGLTDWSIPAGSWSMQGSYLDAVQSIAQAARGYLQPHATDATLRVLPTYPIAPWDWASASPDIVLPAGAVEVEDMDEIYNPPYNRVMVGSQRWALTEVKRAGTPGDLLAPQYMHDALTDIQAARQAGIAVLGESGLHYDVQLTTMVLPETGLIHPGKLVQYTDADNKAWRGLVRAMSLNVQFPVMTQTLTLECQP